MNEHKFDGLGKVYSEFRPSYPGELIDFLKLKNALGRETEAADIGSGTGKLTSLLLAAAKRVYAVEPNAEMRKAAEKDLSRFDNFISVDGTAENTTLPENSVNLITAAQAFHWFSAENFKKECRRILKPDGMVALIWNDRDETSLLIKRNAQINSEYCPRFKGFSNNMKSCDFSDFFCGEYEAKEFPFPIEFDEESFIGRNLSSSYAPRKGESSYEAYIAALRELFCEFQSEGILIMPNFTRLYLGRV